MLLLVPPQRKLVIGCIALPFETSSSVESADLAIGRRAASISHIKTSPPRPPEATILLYMHGTTKICDIFYMKMNRKEA